MISLSNMDTIQIEITSACHKNCSNCTRLCHHYRKPFMMTWEEFAQAVDSLQDFPNMVGVMGGEPLLHPQFEEFCKYLQSKIPRERAGLWSSLPEGKEHYRQVIVDTFDNIFINDHSRNDIYHWPMLVAADDMCEDKAFMWYRIDNCWAQQCWSASVNPNGAFFCEVAASFSMLLGRKETAWPVVKDWWKNSLKDYIPQMQEFCPRCGFAMPLMKRLSNDEIDDITPSNLELLQAVGSPKIARGEYLLYDKGLVEHNVPMATYKDTEYRNYIARRYGLFLSTNAKNFWSPYLLRNWDGAK
jgi:hypothetical protein